MRALRYFFPYVIADAASAEEQFRRNIHLHGNLFFRYPWWDPIAIAAEEEGVFQMHCCASEEQFKKVLGEELGEQLAQLMQHRCSRECKACPTNQ